MIVVAGSRKQGISVGRAENGKRTKLTARNSATLASTVSLM